MKITLKEWQWLDRLAREAKKAVGNLDSGLVALSCKYFDGQPEFEMLHKLTQICDNALFELSRLDVHPQSEWMGGDSSDPKNFKWREPNCVGLPRDYLKEE